MKTMAEELRILSVQIMTQSKHDNYALPVPSREVGKAALSAVRLGLDALEPVPFNRASNSAGRSSNFL